MPPNSTPSLQYGLHGGGSLSRNAADPNAADGLDWSALDQETIAALAAVGIVPGPGVAPPSAQAPAAVTPPGPAPVPADGADPAAPPPGSDSPDFDWAAWLQSLLATNAATPPNEDALKAQVTDANNKANELYSQLTAFQTTQASVNSSLLLQAQIAARQPGALLPDKSGEVVYGGSASATKVGLGDLMLA